MIAFEVQDMSCGHCVASITKAVQALDAQAQVQIDLPRHLVQVQAGRSDAAQIEAAIRDAGFTPVPVQAA
ncbi:Heavy metal transport/detoxification protein [Leptothrix cholodnii SP-6]|uniref:Heavy metal transport/detoxification protein n=1 Tax=Leptothrix cholodnii (strain ATCC 51168 / LMG 8142 / SP-6) TaxID=395495 RepID=B1XZX4_LEPCP|nr:heavy-metal-associated domain-containing protein [Leptothrix cholodnii]ACB34101.1 Heavy metal transport/detoxification protein [Leptothrix cholodnii SP-6]